MLFSINESINFKETGLHITDRFVVIPFNATFTDNTGNRDIDIGNKLCRPLALQIIATKSILAFYRVLKNGKFTIPSNIELETHNYFMQCNSVLEFCTLFPINTFIGKTQYYSEYCKWCQENNYKEVCNAQFGKQILALGYRSERYSFKGVRSTYYSNSSFDNNRCLGIYQTFLADKDDKFINNSMTFENYLWKRLYDENN